MTCAIRALCATMLLAMLLPISVFGQARPTIAGQVIAADTRNPIAGAVLAAGGVSVVSNENGAFTIELAPDRGQLQVTAAGFMTASVPIDTTANTALTIALVRRPVEENVTVLGDADPAATAPATLDVSPTVVLNVAGAGDNIFKALQTLPGISATDDFGSRLAVRGGGPDQNLTVMDEVEIHNPYRLFGLTSAFNPETIDSFELTAGGFGVEYGDRLSSILVVENRAGVTDRAFAGSTAFSITDANVVLEGKLPGSLIGSWLVTGRRTYYDLIADRITGTDLPSFGDVQAKGNWRVRPGHTLTLFGLRSRERTDATFTDSGDEISIGDDSRNDVVSMTYRAVLGPRVSARTTAAWYDYRDDLAVDGSISDGARRSNSADEAGQASIVFTRGLGVRDLSVRQEVDAAVGARHLVGAGFDVHALRTSWGWTIDGDRNSSVANGSAVIGGSGLPSLLASTRRSTRAAAWVQDRVQLGPRLRMTPGVRIDRSGLNDETVVSPRVSGELELTPETTLRAAFGRFTQSPGYEKLLQSDYFVDLTSTDANALRSERATHAIVGLEHALTPAVTARAEAYSKRFDRLLIGRLETPDEVGARVTPYDFPASLADSIPTAPQITSIPVNGGKGHAYGFDAYIEKRQLAASDRLYGWVSYTWGRANLDAYGIQRPFDYDRRHALSVVSTVGVRPRIDLSATLRVASGFPATLPVGLRVAADKEEDTGRLVPAVDANGLTVWGVDFGDVSNLSRGRLPMFARLDLRVTFKPRTAAGRWQFYIEVLNALNRKNVSRLEPELTPNPDSDRPSIGYSEENALPLLPSAGFRFRF